MKYRRYPTLKQNTGYGAVNHGLRQHMPEPVVYLTGRFLPGGRRMRRLRDAEGRSKGKAMD